MLLYIDEMRHIRIVRQADAGGSREPIGRIRKHDMEVDDELSSKLDPAEREEVAAALALLATGERARLAAEVAQLPELMREIVEFYRHDATAFEQRWIRGAVQEAMRLIRGHDRAAADAPKV